MVKHTKVLSQHHPQHPLLFSVDVNGTVVYADNIVVKQEDAPRDYSADIKGSGSNKTLTPNGQAGVGYEIPGYYGSALSFPNGGSGGGDDCLRVTSSDFAFGTGDFTVEVWINPDSFIIIKLYLQLDPTMLVIQMVLICGLMLTVKLVYIPTHF